MSTSRQSSISWRAVASGIEDILIITNRKGIIEDHFDHAVELEQRRRETPNVREVNSITNLANIYFIRQKRQKGLPWFTAQSLSGTSLSRFCTEMTLSRGPRARSFAGLMRNTALVVGIKEVTVEQIVSYSSLKVQPLRITSTLSATC